MSAKRLGWDKDARGKGNQPSVIRACLVLPSELLRSYPQGWLVRGRHRRDAASLGPSSPMMRPLFRLSAKFVNAAHDSATEPFEVTLPAVASTCRL